MDRGSLIGIVIALSAVVAGQALEGGSIASLVQPAAFVIVFAGTLGAVLIQSEPGVFARGVRMLASAFARVPDGRGALAADLARWAAVARREGLLALERCAGGQPAFIHKGLMLVADGVDPQCVRQILEVEIAAFETRERGAARVWEAAGGYAPTVGILGAVLGLIHVMENLSDPSRLGQGIAVAFVATVYGVGLANLVFLPIAAKLKARVASQVATLEMAADGLAGIAAGDHPRVVEDRLTGYLAAA